MSGCGGGPSIHVIAVPIQGMDPFHPASIHGAHHAPQMSMMKPPDYETAIGSKPPSYDEAVRVHPAVFLQLNTPAENPSAAADIPDPAAVPASVPPPSPPTSGGSVNHRPPCCTIDCPHCSGNGAWSYIDPSISNSANASNLFFCLGSRSSWNIHYAYWRCAQPIHQYYRIILWWCLSIIPDQMLLYSISYRTHNKTILWAPSGPFHTLFFKSQVLRGINESHPSRFLLSKRAFR